MPWQGGSSIHNQGMMFSLGGLLANGKWNGPASSGIIKILSNSPFSRQNFASRCPLNIVYWESWEHNNSILGFTITLIEERSHDWGMIVDVMQLWLTLSTLGMWCIDWETSNTPSTINFLPIFWNYIYTKKEKKKKKNKECPFISGTFWIASERLRQRRVFGIFESFQINCQLYLMHGKMGSWLMKHISIVRDN